MSSQALKAVATGGEPPAKLSDMKPKEQIAYLLKTKQGEISKMLPKHLNADRLLKVAQIAATTTPALAKCDVASLVGAIGQCAQMGLEPNTVLGHAYLIPFENRGANKTEVQFIIGYRGMLDLARRSGQIVAANPVNIQPVRIGFAAGRRQIAFNLILRGVIRIQPRHRHTATFGIVQAAF